MPRFQDIVTDNDGNGLPGAIVTVRDYPSGNLSTLTADSGGSLTNPIVADANGAYYFNAANAIYSLEFRLLAYEPAREVRLVNLGNLVDSVTLADGTSTANGAGLVAFNSSLSYLAGTVGGFLKSLIATGGASLIGANDGSSGSLFTTVGGFIAKLLSSAGSSVIGFIQSGTGAVFRFAQDKLRDRVSVKDFGAVADSSTDNAAAFAAALATGKTAFVPYTGTGQYNLASLALTGNMALETEPGVVLHCTSTTGLNLSGSNNYVKIAGEINAPLAANAVRVFNLQFSHIDIRRIGTCTTACLFHDASVQTINEGNNRFVINNIQAGGIPYAIKWDSHATFTCEGNTVDLIVGFAATTCGLLIGSNHDTCCFNEWNVCFDAQGVTPMLIDVYDDKNGIRLRNWAAISSPPIAHVRFNTGCNGCHMTAYPGVQDTLVVSDLGSNTWEVASGNGIRLIGGARRFLSKIGFPDSSGVGGSVTQITSKATSVTLNKVCGQITTTAAALAANTGVYFGLVNSVIEADDEVRVWIKSGAADPTAYALSASGNGAGSRSIGIRNVTAGSLSETLVLGFNIARTTIS